MEIKFLKTLVEVHDKYVELWENGKNPKATINQNYNQLYIDDEELNVKWTNNELNSMTYSKLDLDILNTYFKINKGKGRWNKEFIKQVNNSIRDAIRNPIKDTAKNNDFEIDSIIRKNVILPASTINPKYFKERIEDKDKKRSYEFHEKVVKIDENSCYFAALTQFGKIAKPDPIICLMNDFPENDEFEDKKFYSFRVNLSNPRIKNPDLFPLAQPSSIEDEGIETRGRFGTELDVNAKNVEVVVNVYLDGEKVINEFDYLYQRYYYTSIEFVSGFVMNLTDEYISWDSSTIKIIFETLKYVKKRNGKDESKIYQQIQQLLKTSLGWGFTRIPDPNNTLEVRLKVIDPYTVIQEERKNKTPRKSSNYIFITPILYTIVNAHIRNWMNIIPYSFHIKDTADAMFITEEGYYRYAYKLPVGLGVGEFKTSWGNLRQYDAKLWVIYNPLTEEIVDMAHGGLTKEVSPYLKTINDWENRHEIASTYAKPRYTLEDLFEFKRYIHEMKNNYENQEDYSSFERYSSQIDGKLAILGGQGTGKTTSIVNALKYTERNILHLFFNKFPASINKDIYASGFKRDLTEKIRDVRTIDSMIYMLYHANNKGRPNYDLLRQSCLNNVSNLYEFIDNFDTIVIDEIQSVNGMNRMIILEILKHHKNVIITGDFKQEWEKNYRKKKPFTLNDIIENVDQVYKLDVNYRNAISIYEFGKKILDDGTISGNKNKGQSRFIPCKTLDEFMSYINEYKEDPDAIIVSRHSRIRLKLWKEYGIKSYSVSDTKSTNPEKVILINSTKLGLHEKTKKSKEYDAIKEIWSGVMRAKEKLLVLEYEGWK